MKFYEFEKNLELNIFMGHDWMVIHILPKAMYGSIYLLTKIQSKNNHSSFTYEKAEANTN